MSVPELFIRINVKNKTKVVEGGRDKALWANWVKIYSSLPIYLERLYLATLIAYSNKSHKLILKNAHKAT